MGECKHVPHLNDYPVLALNISVNFHFKEMMGQIIEEIFRCCEIGAAHKESIEKFPVPLKP